MAEISVEVLQQTLMDLDRACRDHGTFGVRWRAKTRWRPSFRFPRGQRIEVERLAKKGSNRRKATLGELARSGARQATRTGDFCSKAAARLTARHSVIVLEDLKVKAMTASARGTTDEPGARVRQKAGLNRAILAKGWGRFELAPANAARRTGSRIVKVDPAYTSQTCHRCKEVHRESRESQAAFRCVACGYREHADVNAAGNILERAAGLAVPGRGDLGDGRSAKRRPSGHVRIPEQCAGERTCAEIHVR